MNSKTHWEIFLLRKLTSKKSWYEEFPSSSINLITELHIKKMLRLLMLVGRSKDIPGKAW